MLSLNKCIVTTFAVVWEQYLIIIYQLLCRKKSIRLDPSFQCAAEVNMNF